MKNKGYLCSNLQKHADVESIEDVHLSEHPNPNFRRDSYKSLNGCWDICISKDKNQPTSWTNKVNVPYAIESPLSFVNHLLEPDEYIHYHKVLSISKDEMKPHIFLHFEGIDQIADVYINNKFVGQHIGGYTSFSFDIKPFVMEGNNDLYIRVKDVTDESYYMRGKQRLIPSGWFYSSSSGIYKPVWIEYVEGNYIKEVIFKPLYDKKSVEVLISTSVEGIVYLNIDGTIFNIESNKKTEIKLNNFHPWNVDDPYLYEVEIKFFNDIIHSYFGIRKIENKIINNQPCILLNDKRLFINGLLAQGYYDLGGLTPKSYDVFEKDIKNVKELGYNTLRIHIKTEIPYFYYLADKYGLLLIQDFPCGGTKYKFFNVVFPRISIKLFNKEKYCTYKNYGREDKEGRDLFIDQATQIVNSLFNHPSIIVYTIFNEAWGEFDPSKNYVYFKSLDNSRLYDTASGWLDSNKSDFFSIHSYTLPARKRKTRNNRPYFLSEVGGTSWIVPNHFIYPKAYGHKTVKKQNQLEKRYKDLYKNLMPQIISGNLNGIIYTELNDCETECNGIYTLDREVLKIDKDLIIDINKEIEAKRMK